MRNQFFEFLSRSGKLESELAALRQSAPDPACLGEESAAANFSPMASLWRSHFEDSAPVLKVLAHNIRRKRDRARRLRPSIVRSPTSIPPIPPSRRRSRTTCFRPIPATPNSSRASATLTPTAICSRSRALLGAHSAGRPGQSRRVPRRRHHLLGLLRFRQRSPPA